MWHTRGSPQESLQTLLAQLAINKNLARLAFGIANASVVDKIAAMPHMQLDQYTVFYEQQGHGECVLLMLPGSLGSTRLEFDRQFDYFDANKFTLISWDAPGFGKSRPPERDYVDCYNRDAKLLMELMSKLNVNNKFNVLGFSDGGRTAMTIASQYPDRVDKLVLVGATSFNSPKERRVFDLCRNIDGWSNDRRALYESIYGEDLQQLWSNWVNANSKLNDFLGSALSLITCSTLLLYGENDIIAPIDPHARHLKRNLIKSRIHIFAKTSHYCHQERCDDFNKIVERFLLSN